MKKAATLFASLLLVAMALTACGGGDDSSSSQPASSTPASSSAPASGSQSGSGCASDVDVQGMLDTLVEAGGLGGTIDVSELDLKASGISVDKIIDWAGAESKTSSENGGIVLVLVTEPGAAADIVTELEAFRDARANDDRYAEFEVARENTSQARIVDEGDCVIYAVSATGAEGYTALDKAISDLFA